MNLRPAFTHYEWLALFATLLCATLLAVDIQRPSYWLDEKISIDIAAPDDPVKVIGNVIEGERRPPGYHLSLWAWTRLVGVNERAARLHSALWAILFIPVTYALTRRFSTRKAAACAAILAALAQVTIGYGQTVRYYTMVATLSALSFALFFAVMRHPARRKLWVAYIATTLLLLYTDYPAYGVVIAQNILALFWWLKRAPADHPRRRWIISQSALALVAALWLPVLLAQRARDFGAADLSNSLAGTALRIIYPFYAWLVGETLFPWAVLAILGAIAALLVMCIGFIRLHNKHKPTWLIAFGVPFIVAQVMLGIVATDSPFVNAPARSMACAGLLFGLMGVGIASLRPRAFTTLTAVMLLISHSAALVNYYRGNDYINTVYNTPAREVAQTIATQAQPADAVVTESDSMVSYYLPDQLRANHFAPDQVDALRAYLTNHPQAVVWQVIMGRDRTRNEISANLGQWLASVYSTGSSTGFAEQDATYRALKSRLIGREAYRYRLVLDEYQPRK